MTFDVGGVVTVFAPGLVLLGLVAGFIAGMFGIGGGWLLVPMLHIVFGIPLPIAVGTSLCQQIGTSIGAFLRHREYGHGEPRVDLVMLGAALLGADAGARLLAKLSSAAPIAIGARALPAVAIVIPAIYVVLLLGVVVISARTDAHADDGGPGPLARVRIPPYVALPRLGRSVSAPVLAYLGFLTGALSGLVGIGGGVALLPILLLGYGFSMKDAAGTGILLLLATVVVGTIEHAAHGHVDLRVALGILAGSSIGAQLGARATVRLSNRVLRRLFAGMLVITAIAIAVDVVRKLA